MTKYSFEFKEKIVLAYLNNEGGAIYLAKRYGVSSESNIKTWVKNYKGFGDAGLMCSRKNKNYTFEEKLSIVKLYLTSEISYRELAIQKGILHPTMIARWVNDFRIAGPDALRPRQKGRKKTLKQSRKLSSTSKDTKNELSVDTSVEHVKELEDELLKLRIENAYLKELRRLRLEEETLLKKQRESSTASEENSN